MTDSKYPGTLDTDAEIVRIDDNITLLGGDAINSLRSAVFNIEETLGVNPQGSVTDVVTRLNASLNSDGTIKAAAIAAIGLVTLPITNSMIATNAAIAESKLDLDYGTAWLKAQMDAISALLNATMSSLAVDIGHLTSHISHPATYGRHQTRDIDGYVGTYLNYNLQGVITDLDTRIIAHLTDTTAAHAASAISFDDTALPIVANNVQDAVAETAILIEGATIAHQDNLHSNGILKAQKVNYGGTDHSYTLIPASAINAAGIGTLIVQFTSVPTDFALVTRGDRIDITVNGNIYTRYVDRTDSPGRVYFLNPIPVTISGTITAAVYKQDEEFVTPSALNVAIRRSDVSFVGGSILQLVHPNAPYILSSGIDIRQITSSVKNIKLGWDKSPYTTGNIDIYTIMTAFSSTPSAWTVENLAMELNNYFAGAYPTVGSGPYLPFVAFTYGGELGIALDVPDGYLAIQNPSSLSAWSAMGFSVGDIAYPLNRKFYINGHKFENIREIVNTTGEIGSGDSSSVINLGQNIQELGLKAPGIVRISNVGANNGTYTFDQTSGAGTVTITEKTFAAATGVGVKIYADFFGLTASPTKRTLYELFIDGYDNLEAVFTGERRVEYAREPVYSSVDLTGYFEVVDISRNFSYSSRRLAFTSAGGIISVQIGTRNPSSAAVLLGGASVILPLTNVIGYRFKVYDSNRVDYIEFEAIADYTLLATGNSLDIDIYTRPSEERYLQIGKVLHNKSIFKFLDDRRLFGTVSRYDVRDDFTRDEITYPQSVLRNCGITRDCNISYTVGGTSFIFLGGQAFVNGTLVDLSRITLNIPKDGAVNTYNLYVNESGELKLDVNDGFVADKLVTPSYQEILQSQDKLLLFTILVNNTSNQITSVTDYRKFVNNIDNKIELSVEEVNSGEPLYYGTFSTLQAAVNYINVLKTTNNISQVIRIKGEIELAAAVVLPAGTILQGDGRSGNAQITLLSEAASVYTGDDTIIRDIAFYGDFTPTGGWYFIRAGSNVTIENCSFYANTYNAYNAGINIIDGSDNVTISRCLFENLSFGMTNTVVSGVSENIYIEENIFTNVRQTACYFYGTTSKIKNIYIAKNIINSAYTDGTPYFIYLSGGASDVIIADNQIFCSDAATAAAGAFIYVDVACVDLSIIGNNIINSGGSNVGILGGIKIDAGSASIINNIISGTYGSASSFGLQLVGSNYNIQGNVIWARRAMLINGPSNIVCNNKINGMDNDITIYTINAASYGLNIFSNNLISNADVSTNNLVQFASSTASGDIITGNYFIFTDSTKSLLRIAGADHIISNNIFEGGNFTVLEPIVITADTTLISNNIFKYTSISSLNGVINDSGTGNINYLNKGATYTKWITIDRSICLADWSWVPAVASQPSLEATTSTTGSNLIAINFSALDIPANSEIQKVTVYYTNSGASGDITFQLYEHDMTTPTSTALNSVAVNASVGVVYGYIDVSPDSTPYYLSDAPKYNSLIVTGKDGTSNFKIIYGMSITYIL